MPWTSLFALLFLGAGSEAYSYNSHQNKYFLHNVDLYPCILKTRYAHISVSFVAER